MKNIKEFIKKAYIEFKKVEWPTKKETLRLTILVIGVSLGVGLFVSLWDYIFKNGLTLLVGK